MWRQGWKCGGASPISPASFSCSLVSSRVSFSFWTSARRASQSTLDVPCFASCRFASRSFVVRCSFSSSASFSMRVFCACASFFSSSCSLSSLSWSSCGRQRKGCWERPKCHSRAPGLPGWESPILPVPFAPMMGSLRLVSPQQPERTFQSASQSCLSPKPSAGFGLT